MKPEYGVTYDALPSIKIHIAIKRKERRDLFLSLAFWFGTLLFLLASIFLF